MVEARDVGSKSHGVQVVGVTLKTNVTFYTLVFSGRWGFGGVFASEAFVVLHLFFSASVLVVHEVKRVFCEVVLIAFLGCLQSHGLLVAGHVVVQ